MISLINEAQLVDKEKKIECLSKVSCINKIVMQPLLLYLLGERTDNKH